MAGPVEMVGRVHQQFKNSDILFSEGAYKVVDEILEEAVDSSTCFLGVCWNQKSAEDTKRELAKLIGVIASEITPVKLRSISQTKLDAEIFVDERTANKTKHFIERFKKGNGISSSEISEAEKAFRSWSHSNLVMFGMETGVPISTVSYLFCDISGQLRKDTYIRDLPVISLTCHAY